MTNVVYVKVLGFRDVERHSLNTVFRLSQGRATEYQLWVPDQTKEPQLALIDVDSYEGGLEIESPGFNQNLKLIAVGERAPPFAWRVFKRPLNWGAVVQAMDELFVPAPLMDIDLDTFDAGPMTVPPGVKASLLVDTSREQRLYLRARLSLAGMLEIDDAQSAPQALDFAKSRHYDLVIINLDSPEIDGWQLVAQLSKLQPAISSVVVSSNQTAWTLQQKAEHAGCKGVLDIPFEPGQIVSLLHKV